MRSGKAVMVDERSTAIEHRQGSDATPRTVTPTRPRAGWSASADQDSTNTGPTRAALVLAISGAHPVECLSPALLVAQALSLRW